MSFKLFIYYCALLGGWAAFLCWAVVQATGIREIENLFVRATLTAGLLGMLVALAVGWLDAVLNSVGPVRLVRAGVCAALGLAGGAVGGLIGQAISRAFTFLVGADASRSVGGLAFIGWTLVGVLVGGSLGVFDVGRAVVTGGDLWTAVKKILKGIGGGILGGFLGGVLFTAVLAIPAVYETLPRGGLTVGLVILGICIGLLIGLAHVMLKEAWLRVEKGFRAGRELMLSKDEITIGRAEGCDLGLFGDNTIEKIHAKIIRQDHRYLLAHAAELGETYVNDQPVTGRPVPLRSGDRIRIGRSVLLFGERQKRERG